MLIALTWAALRRRSFSLLCTILLGMTWAALFRVPAPAVLVVWVLASLLVLEAWLVLEPVVLGWLGCRSLTPGEDVRLSDAARRFTIRVRIADETAMWVGAGLRTVVVSRGAFELVDDAALYGLLAQAAARQRAPIVLRELVVWLGNAPVVAAWCASFCLVQLGRLLAFALGGALVLPLLLWPTAFVHIVGHALGALLIGLVGALLVSGGQPAYGIALWLAWPLVLGLRTLLAWESRGAEADADCAAASAGFGWQLLSALEWLAPLEETQPTRAQRLLVRSSAPTHLRIKRLWSIIHSS